MELIIITSAQRTDDEVQTIIKLFDNGLETLHLRKPKLPSVEVESILAGIPQRYHKHIMIHGHYELALKYKLKGVHLHRSDRSPTWKSRWKRLKLKLRHPKMLVSASFRSVQSVQENGWSFDYVLVGPIFTSQTHYHMDDPATVNALRSQIATTNQRMIAIGGINKDRIPLIRAAGFDGVGISGALWKHLDKNDIPNMLKGFAAA